jgi:hypothetical protein
VLYVVAGERSRIKDAKLLRCVRCALVLVGLALVLWVLDRVACQPIKNALGFYPQLHAWWHIFAYAAFWNCLVLVSFVRLQAAGKRWRKKVGLVVKMQRAGFLGKCENRYGDGSSPVGARTRAAQRRRASAEAVSPGRKASLEESAERNDRPRAGSLPVVREWGGIPFVDALPLEV